MTTHPVSSKLFVRFLSITNQIYLHLLILYRSLLLCCAIRRPFSTRISKRKACCHKFACNICLCVVVFIRYLHRRILWPQPRRCEDIERRFWYNNGVALVLVTGTVCSFLVAIGKRTLFVLLGTWNSGRCLTRSVHQWVDYTCLCDW